MQEYDINVPNCISYSLLQHTLGEELGVGTHWTGRQGILQLQAIENIQVLTVCINTVQDQGKRGTTHKATEKQN